MNIEQFQVITYFHDGSRMFIDRVKVFLTEAEASSELRSQVAYLESDNRYERVTYGDRYWFGESTASETNACIEIKVV